VRVTTSSNIGEVIRETAKLHPQFRFAAALALTESVKAARDAMPGEVESVFDRPTAFTKGGFFIEPARKDRLQASVGIKDRQAEYLQYQVQGGTRQPKRQALRLPSVVQLNEYGNVPAGLIKSLINRAKAGKRATGAQSRRFGVSQAVDLFYGEPGDGRPAGIYKRVVVSALRHELVPIIVFPKQPARYERLFDFHERAERIVVRSFEPALASAWQRALATAK
jgi:hypothetical protein